MKCCIITAPNFSIKCQNKGNSHAVNGLQISSTIELLSEKELKKMLLILGNICGQNFRSERVNINQLEHQDINLVLLKEGRSPPSTHAHMHPSLPPLRSGVSSCPRVGACGKALLYTTKWRRHITAHFKQSSIKPKPWLRFDTESTHGESVQVLDDSR